MKKLLTFLTLLTLSIGVSWAGTYSLTPDNASTGSDATSYIITLTEFNYNDVSWKMNQWNPSSLQIRTNQTSAAAQFRFYNTSAFPGRITKVVIKFSALTVIDASKLMFIGGSSEVSATSGGTAGTWNSSNKTLTWVPDANDNFTYFAFYQNGKAASGTNKLATSDAIVVTYDDGGGEPTPTCEAPTFNPEPGNTLYESQNVAISCITTGSTIRYTMGTNPEDPTTTTGTVYTGPISIDETTTIKAIAYAENYDPSNVVTATYIFGEPASDGQATFNAAVDKGTSPFVKSPITFTCSDGVLNNGSEYRLYKNSETTFSVEDGYTITKIEFTCTSDNPISGFESISGLTPNGDNGTWVGEAQSVTFTASNKQVRATLINVYFVESSAITVGVPSISFSDFTAGSTTVTATITPGTNATATLYKIGEDGTYATYSGPIEIDLTEEASPITVYAKSTNGDNESSEVSATFTLPDLAVSISPSSYSGTEAQSVEISATNIVGSAALTYKINDGTVQTYSDAISLSTPGTYNITAYASDDRADGEPVSATATITIIEQSSGDTYNVTFDASVDKGENSISGNPDEIIKDGVKFSSTNAALGLTNYSEYRLYQGSTTTFSVPAGSLITKIVFTGNDTSKPVSNLGIATGSTGIYTVDNNVGTWIGEANSVAFSASAQARCSLINVTYIVGETQETADYYLVGTFNMNGNDWIQIDPAYKFNDNQDGTYSLNGKDLPDNVQFKIIKVVDNDITWYGGSVGDGQPYGLHGNWHTNIPLKDTPDQYQSIQNFKMEVGGESNFTIYTSTMTFDVEKTKFYLRKSTDNWVNHEMTPVNGGGWTLAEESFDADAQFHFVDGWNVQRGTSQTEGDNLYWIYQSATDIQCGLDQNKPNFKIVTAGDYTLTVNSALTQLTVHCILPTYEASIASDINGGTVAFNASGNTTPLELTENTEVRVYVTPQTSEWELATLTYTVTNSSPVSFIDNYNNDGGYYYFLMPAGDVVINATFTWQGGEVTETTYALVTSNSDIEVGAKYIIVNEENSKALVKAYQSQGIDIDNHTTTITNALGIAEFVLGNGTDEGTYTFKYKDNYLYNSSGTSLDITGTSSTNNNWTISIGGADDYFATITSSNNRLIHFLATANNNQGDFRAYSNSQNSSNVQLYKEVPAPVEATLAQIIALGDEADGKLYKISDVNGLLGVYKNGTSIWFKDEAQAVDYQDPMAAQYEYYTVVEQSLDINKSEKDFAQNNWIEVVFPSEKNFTNAYVRNLTGTYSFENGNPKLTLTAAVDEENDVTEVPSSGLAYDLNPYMAVNFAGNQTYTNNGETKTFFFSKPKAQEYALILWAVYAGNNQFNMPTDTDDNYYGFTGSFTINPEYNSYSTSGLTPGDTYNFKAVIRKAEAGGSKAGETYEVYPTDLNPDVPTAINGVVVNGVVKSVKYVNVAGMISDTPFQGVNIVVTEYTDGSRTTTKMLRK